MVHGWWLGLDPRVTLNVMVGGGFGGVRRLQGGLEEKRIEDD